MTTKQTKPAAPIKPERLIYLGPNLTKYGLTQYAVYKGGFPSVQASEAFEKYPLIKLLFVPPSDMAKTEKAIKTNGTPQNEAYKQTIKRGEN